MARRIRTEDPAGTAPYDESEIGTPQGTAGDSRAQDSSSGAGIADSAKQAASQAKEAAGRVMDQAKNEAASRADQQRETAATGFQAVAHAFRNMGDDLRNQEQGPIAQYAAEMGNAMGGQVERFANYLRGRDVHQLISDAEDFARRSPAIFLGGAFVLGLATSRFLKSSRPVSRSAAARSEPLLLPPVTTGPVGLGPDRPGYSAQPERDAAVGNPGFGGGLDPAGGL
jgi:hypothetical protein